MKKLIFRLFLLVFYTRTYVIVYPCIIFRYCLLDSIFGHCLIFRFWCLLTKIFSFLHLLLQLTVLNTWSCKPEVSSSNPSQCKKIFLKISQNLNQKLINMILHITIFVLILTHPLWLSGSVCYQLNNWCWFNT